MECGHGAWGKLRSEAGMNLDGTNASREPETTAI